MPGTIVLVRHGPSAHVHTGPLDRDGVERWRVAYDAAGILDDAIPASRALEIARDATHIVASDLQRAIASAALLAPGRSVSTSALLRETPLAIPRWPTRLPLSVWGTVSYLAWRYRLVRGTDPDDADRTRVAAAADLLARLVADGSSACVVTHGAFRVLLARHLVTIGWTPTGRNGGYDHWSTWRFSAPDRRRAGEERDPIRGASAE